MPNKFTPVLDALAWTSSSADFFDTIFGEWEGTDKQQNAWALIAVNGMTSEASEEEKQLFWCFIAELSDEDLQECFPEIFPSSQSSPAKK